MVEKPYFIRVLVRFFKKRRIFKSFVEFKDIRGNFKNIPQDSKKKWREFF
jgi:hypothetical protein